MCTADGRVFGSVAEALRMANATMDYLNGPEAADLDPAACGLVLRSLAEVQAKFTAAHAAVLARFDAADAHDSDGYGTSAAWLMAMTDMTRGGRQDQGPARCGCCATTPRWPVRWLARRSRSRRRWRSSSGRRSCPAELRAETIKILVQAARSGASLDDLRIIAGGGAAEVARLAAGRR